ncbi:Mis6-domain-containing protein [Cryomyces antarcticus]
MEEEIRPESLEDALSTLAEAASTPARDRKRKVSTTVDAIIVSAFNHGLDSTPLSAVVGIVTKKNELDQTINTNLVRNLYPLQKVSSDVVLVVVGSLGNGRGKPASSTQVALVRWLVLVQEELQDPTCLSALYGVFFSMLDMISLRASLCHLLALITKRKHVKPFRIQQLLELSRFAVEDPALMRLLDVYREYYPDVVVGSASSGKTSKFTCPDPKWRSRLRSIREVHARSDAAIHTADQNGFRVARQGAKRSKISVVPGLHTHCSHEHSVALENVDSVNEFVGKLESVELPNQLVAILKDPLLQKYLVLKPSVTATKRIELWLSKALEEEIKFIRDGLGMTSRLSEILQGLFNYTRYKKILLPSAVHFLEMYLPLWDGVSNTAEIFGLLAYLPISPFLDVRRRFFSAAEAAIIMHAPEPYENLVTLYIDLTSRWAQHIGSTASDRSGADANMPIEAFIALTDHVSTLVLSILCSPTCSGSIVSATLGFYQTLTAVLFTPANESHSIPIVLPPAQVVYLLLFTSSLSELSRLLAILASYKQAFEASISATIRHPPATTNRFNGWLMDVCNLFWRSLALQKSDANAFGCFCPESVQPLLRDYLETIDPEYSLVSSFGLSQSHVLSSLSAAALRALEDKADEEGLELNTRHAGPVTRRSLTKLDKDGGLQISWKEYRVEVLKWLDARGVGGVKELMYATMKHLIQGKV